MTITQEQRQVESHLPSASLDLHSGFQSNLSLADSNGGTRGRTGAGLLHLSVKQETCTQHDTRAVGQYRRRYMEWFI